MAIEASNGNGNFSGGHLSDGLGSDTPVNTGTGSPLEEDNTPHSNRDGDGNFSGGDSKKVTVDEVFGSDYSKTSDRKNGDYVAFSNEKSTLGTSTFGGDLESSPADKTKHTAQLDTMGIDALSIDTTKKDKESKDVLDTRKRREEAEYEEEKSEFEKELESELEDEEKSELEDADLTNDISLEDLLTGEESEEEVSFLKNLLAKGGVFTDAASDFGISTMALNTSASDSGSDSGSEPSVGGSGYSVFDKKQQKKLDDAEKIFKDSVNHRTKGYDSSNPGDDAFFSGGAKEEESYIENLYTRVSEEKSQDLQSKSDTLGQKTRDIEKADAKLSAAKAKQNELLEAYKDSQDEEAKVKEVLSRLSANAQGIKDSNPILKTALRRSDSYQTLIDQTIELAKQYDIDIGDTSKMSIDDIVNAYAKINQGVSEYYSSKTEEVSKELQYANKVKEDAELAYNNALKEQEYAKAAYDKALSEYNRTGNIPSDTKQAFDNAIKAAAENGADEQTVQAMTDIAASIEGTKAEMQKAIAENDIPTYIKAQKQYNENLDEALEIGNRFTQTDFNKDFVAAVAKANDFDVTLPDGTKMTYSQFATDMATKSPAVAKAMYEAKAQKYEASKHPVLAKIERTKAEIVGTWLGSKLTQADNQVRNQYIQMAELNMRATYAVYNNAKTPEAKAKIAQANSLMQATTALKASTGFFSGMGDSMSDGEFGTTNVGDLSTYQKVLAYSKDVAISVLGLGVTPTANVAYQNAYYLNPDSKFFSKDFDEDGFTWTQEYGNNATVGIIAGATSVTAGVALMFNPSTAASGTALITKGLENINGSLYGIKNQAEDVQDITEEILNHLKEGADLNGLPKEARDLLMEAVNSLEVYRISEDEVNDYSAWEEGSGTTTAGASGFNQSLTYEEWLKLIESDPVLRDYYIKKISEKLGK